MLYGDSCSYRKKWEISQYCSWVLGKDVVCVHTLHMGYVISLETKRGKGLQGEKPKLEKLG